jgi:hypothetical protein
MQTLINYYERQAKEGLEALKVISNKIEFQDGAGSTSLKIVAPFAGNIARAKELVELKRKKSKSDVEGMIGGSQIDIKSAPQRKIFSRTSKGRTGKISGKTKSRRKKTLVKNKTKVTAKTKAKSKSKAKPKRKNITKRKKYKKRSKDIFS